MTSDYRISGSCFGSGSGQNIERHRILQTDILLTYKLVNRRCRADVGRKYA